MNDKEKVVDRLEGKCECENGEAACGVNSPYDNNACLRDLGHKGKHFACSVTKHKTFMW